MIVLSQPVVDERAGAASMLGIGRRQRWRSAGIRLPSNTPREAVVLGTSWAIGSELIRSQPHHIVSLFRQSSALCAWPLHQMVSCGGLPVERCAQLRRALLAGIVDVEEPETGAEAIGPLEIIHQAPMEIAAHWHPLGRGALQLRQGSRVGT